MDPPFISLRRILIFLPLLPSFLHEVKSCGPMTHVYFCSSAALKNESNISDQNIDAFLSGCNSPDAFKKLWPEFHSLEFAAKLFVESRLDKMERLTLTHLSTDKILANFNATTASSTTNQMNMHRPQFEQTIDSMSNYFLEEFAIGYGCHIVNDGVGHHANGFLNPLADHEIEINVDAKIFHEGSDKDLFKKRSLTEDILRLISKAAQNFTSDSTPKSTEIRFLRGKEYYPPQVNTALDVDYSRLKIAAESFQAMATTEKEMLRFEPSALYRGELIQSSFCNVSSYEEVNDNLRLSETWATKACVDWRRMMLELVTIGSHTIDGLEGFGGSSLNEGYDKSIGNHIQNMYELIDNLFKTNGGSSCVKRVG